MANVCWCAVVTGCASTRRRRRVRERQSRLGTRKSAAAAPGRVGQHCCRYSGTCLKEITVRCVAVSAPRRPLGVWNLAREPVSGRFFPLFLLFSCFSLQDRPEFKACHFGVMWPHTLSLLLPFASGAVHFQVDPSVKQRVDEGKAQLDKITTDPSARGCWATAVERLQDGCKGMDDAERSKLAVLVRAQPASPWCTLSHTSFTQMQPHVARPSVPPRPHARSLQTATSRRAASRLIPAPTR